MFIVLLVDRFDDDDDFFGVFCPFQHYLSHTEMMEV